MYPKGPPAKVALFLFSAPFCRDAPWRVSRANVPVGVRRNHFSRANVPVGVRRNHFSRANVPMGVRRNHFSREETREKRHVWARRARFCILTPCDSLVTGMARYISLGEALRQHRRSALRGCRNASPRLLSVTDSLTKLSHGVNMQKRGLRPLMLNHTRQRRARNAPRPCINKPQPPGGRLRQCGGYGLCTNYALCIVHYALCIVHYALCIMHCALCIMHCALCIVHCALCIVHCALCIVHCALCIMHCALCIMHCALCIMHCALIK